MPKTRGECTQRKLDFFSWKHYTYINQIFGDEDVRKLISSIYPHKDLVLKKETAGEGFDEGSDHHILYDNTKKKKICSVDTLKYQNTNKNTYDTLCQSYTLLIFFDKKMPKTHKGRQMAMIEMYRELLSDKAFVDRLSRDIINNKAVRGRWSDYINDVHGDTPLKMDKGSLVRNMRDTLNRWEEYGYHHFTGDGSCK
jgi:hypothetical protein